MSIVALSPAAASAQWCPEQLRTEQHEWGVVVDPKATEYTTAGAAIRGWINEQRSKGWGRVMTVHALRPLVAGRIFGAVGLRHDDPTWDDVDAEVCGVLNNRRSGLIVVPIERCTSCG